MARGRKTPLTNSMRQARASLPIPQTSTKVYTWDEHSPYVQRMWKERMFKINLSTPALIYLMIGLLSRDKPVTYNQLKSIWLEIYPAYDEYPGLERDVNDLLSRLETIYLESPLSSRPITKQRIWQIEANRGEFESNKNYKDADKILELWHKQQMGIEQELLSLAKLPKDDDDAKRINRFKEAFIAG